MKKKRYSSEEKPVYKKGKLLLTEKPAYDSDITRYFYEVKGHPDKVMMISYYKNCRIVKKVYDKNKLGGRFDEFRGSSKKDR